jgi:6-phosphogluconolactonase
MEDDVAGAALALFLDAEPRTIVLSGGSTPRALYERLSGADYPWAEVEVFYGDERCVPPQDERSNVGMARTALLSKVQAREYPIEGATCDADGYEAVLRARFPGDAPAFDLVINGLGPDGHTASMFPGKPAVEVFDRWVVQVPEAGLAPWVPRVTLTVPALSGAALGVFLVAGAEKREALTRLLDGDDIPAARLGADRMVILADRAAAGAA